MNTDMGIWEAQSGWTAQKNVSDGTNSPVKEAYFYMAVLLNRQLLKFSMFSNTV